MLEERLEHVDQQEASPLFLGKSRSDGNTDRISLLSEIESGLVDYGIHRVEIIVPERLINARYFRRANVSYVEFRLCSTKRRRKPAELAERYRLPGQRGNGVSRTSRARVFSSSGRQCDSAARSLGRGKTHPLL